MGKKHWGKKRALAWLLSLILALQVMPVETFAWIGPLFETDSPVTFSEQSSTGKVVKKSYKAMVMQNDYIRFELDRNTGTIMRTVPTRTAAGTTLAGDIDKGVYQELQFKAGSKQLKVTSVEISQTEDDNIVAPEYGFKKHQIIRAIYHFKDTSEIAEVHFCIVKASRGKYSGTTNFPVLASEDMNDGRTWMMQVSCQYKNGDHAFELAGYSHLRLIAHRPSAMGHAQAETQAALGASYTYGEVGDQTTDYWGISQGLSETSTEGMREIFTNGYAHANPFFLMDSMYLWNPDGIGGVYEGVDHNAVYDDILLYGGVDTVSYVPPKDGQNPASSIFTSNNASDILTAESSNSSDKKVALTWGFRDLYKAGEQIEDIPQSTEEEFVNVEQSARKIAVIPSGSSFKTVELDASAADPANAVAVYRGSFTWNPRTKYYDFASGASISPTACVTFDVSEGGYFRVKQDGTVEHKRIDLSTPMFMFFKHKAGEDYGPVFSYSTENDKTGLNLSIDPDKNAAIVSAQIPRTRTRLEGAILSKAGDVCFYGHVGIETVFDSDFDLSQLLFGYDGFNKFRLKGMAAEANLRDKSLFGLKLNTISGKINTMTDYYHFQVDVNAYDLLKFAADLELMRTSNGTLMPNTLYGKLVVSGPGIPLIPPAPVVTINGGGLGFYDLVKTIDGDYLLIPPIKLKGTVAGTIVEVMAGELSLTVGPGGVEVEASNLKVPTDKGANLIKSAKVKIDIEGAKESVLTVDGSHTSMQTYTGANVSGSLYAKMSLLNEGKYKDVIQAEGKVGLSMFSGLNSKKTIMYLKLNANGTVKGSVHAPKDWTFIGGDELIGVGLDMALGGSTFIKASSQSLEDLCQDAIGKLKPYIGVAYTQDLVGKAYLRAYYVAPVKGNNWASADNFGLVIESGESGEFIVSNYRSGSRKAAAAPGAGNASLQEGSLSDEDDLQEEAISDDELREEALPAGEDALPGDETPDEDEVPAGDGLSDDVLSETDWNNLETAALIDPETGEQKGLVWFDENLDPVAVTISDLVEVEEEVRTQSGDFADEETYVEAEEASLGEDARFSGETFFEDGMEAVFYEEETGDAFSGDENVGMLSDDGTGDMFFDDETGDLFLDDGTGDMFTDDGTGDEFFDDENVDAFSGNTAGDMAEDAQDQEEYGLESVYEEEVLEEEITEAEDEEETPDTEEPLTETTAEEMQEAGEDEQITKLIEMSPDTVLDSKDHLIMEITSKGEPKPDPQAFFEGLLVDGEKVTELVIGTDGQAEQDGNAMISNDENGDPAYPIYVFLDTVDEHDQPKENWVITSQKGDFEAVVYKNSPFESLQASFGADRMTVQWDGLEEGGTYELHTYYVSDNGAAYMLDEPEDGSYSGQYELTEADMFAQSKTFSLPAVGTFAENGVYYPKTALLMVIRDDFDGDGEISETEKAYIPVGSVTGTTPVNFTNSLTPQAPASVTLAPAGNEAVECAFSEVPGADGYQIRIFKDGEDTGFGYDFRAGENGALLSGGAVIAQSAGNQFTVRLNPTVGSTGTLTYQDAEGGTITEQMVPLQPGDHYSVSVSAYQFLDTENQASPVHSAQKMSGDITLSAYREADVEVLLNGYAASAQTSAEDPEKATGILEGVLDGSSSDWNLIVHASDAATGQKAYTVSVSNEATGESYVKDTDPNGTVSFTMQGFEGVASYLIMVTDKAAKDTTTRYLMVTTDSVPPILLPDQESYTADENGDFQITGIGEPGCEIRMDDKTFQVADDGTFTVTGNAGQTYWLCDQRMLVWTILHDNLWEDILSQDDFDAMIRDLESMKSDGVIGDYIVNPAEYSSNVQTYIVTESFHTGDVYTEELLAYVNAGPDPSENAIFTDIHEIIMPVKVTDHAEIDENPDAYPSVQEMFGVNGRLVKLTEVDAQGNTVEASVFVNAHIHSLTHVDAKPATCTDDGNVEYYHCATCGRNYEDASGETELTTVSIPGLGYSSHTPGAWKRIKDATVAAEGLETAVCTVCGVAMSRKLPKLKAAISLSSGTIKVDKTTVPLKKKQKLTNKITANLQPDDGISSVKTGNKKIATASYSGTKITIKAGKKTGTTTITVKTKYGASTTFNVRVQKKAVAAKSVPGFPKKLTLKKGKTYQLPKDVNPISAAGKITFSSSAKKVASVNAGGKIKAVKKGKAKITMKIGKKKFVCKVTVK